MEGGVSKIFTVWGRSVKKVFSFIITYFNKKIKFNLYAPTAIEFAEKGFHMKNVLGLRCDILENGNLNC